VTSPIDSNLPAGAGSTSGLPDTRADVARTDGLSTSESPALNIPNDGANYHWFLTENTGSRTTISPTDRFNADMAIDTMASVILSHIRSE